MEPDKGVQVGPEPSISNGSSAMAYDTIPGFAGNLIEADIVINGSKSAVYKSTAYPANADGAQRPGAVVEYSSEFSVGEGIGGISIKSELPTEYLRVEFLENGAKRAYIITDFVVDADFGAKCSFEQQPTEKGTTYLIGSYRPYFVAPRFTGAAVITGGFSNGNVLRVYNAPARTGRHVSQLNYKNSKLLVVDEYELPLTNIGEFTGYDKLGVFAYNGASNIANPSIAGTRIFDISFSHKSAEIGHFIPAVNPQGEACFFDTITKTSFFSTTNSKFIVGFTITQARKLGNLPSTGGTLTISLPSNWQEDTGVVNALAKAEANGWVLTYQTYEADASASSTLALRRIWVRKTQDENGTYVAADGSRWYVEWCAGMIGAEPADHGYEPFRSVDAAAEYWGLTLWVDPEQKEEFI